MFVKFSDGNKNNEGAVDQGGPKREFLRLVMKHIKANYFDSNGFLTMDASGMFL
jgi:hypothetical protein